MAVLGSSDNTKSLFFLSARAPRTLATRPLRSMFFLNLIFWRIGALHWGMEFAGYGGQKGYPRLFLGAAPVVYGWSTLALDPTAALIAQWVGFTGLWWADLKATNAGWGKSRMIKILELVVFTKHTLVSPEVVFSISLLPLHTCWYLVSDIRFQAC